jgi:predicted CXXCH cytochrome family protein
MKPDKKHLGAIVLFMAFVALAMTPALAYAYAEGGASRTLCVDCHGATAVSASASTVDTGTVTGPHMGYTSTSRKCQSCHQVHAAPAAQLLPAETVKDTCNVCHDGTGGGGVYGTLIARNITPAGQHRIGVTRTVPGGDPVTGLDKDMAFSAEGGYLTCTDCHTPHGSDVVAAFTGDRARTGSDLSTPTISTRLLKKRPGGITYDVNEYGSSWCLACHQGRGEMTTPLVDNHPVATDTVAVYNRLTRMASDNMGAATQTASLGGSNRGYLMTRATLGILGAKGAGPICQQCHEDSRDVGQLRADGTQADPATFTISALDGFNAADNPRFQNFPHETENRRLLAETDDGLCTNCHRP